MAKNDDLNLTDEEILLLNNVTYLTSRAPFNEMDYSAMKERTVKGLFRGVDPDVLRSVYGRTRYKGDISGLEWADIVEGINNNPKFDNLLVGEVLLEKGVARANCFTDRGGKTAVVVFHGTGEKEWLDNFEGGYLSDTKAQKDALEWFERLCNGKQNEFEYVIIAGHSKGGNKAKYITIKSDKVDRCISFNAQGFSSEFIRDNWKAIQNNKTRITSYATAKDFVNILLFDLGEKKFFVQGHGVDDFKQNHAPNSFFNKEMKFDFTNQDKSLKEIQGFTNFFLTKASNRERKLALDYLGNICQLAFGQNDLEAAIVWALNPVNVEAAAIVLVYLLKYQELSGIDMVSNIKFFLHDMELLNETIAMIFDGLIYLLSDNETITLVARGNRTAGLFGIEKKHTNFFDEVAFIAVDITLKG